MPRLLGTILLVLTVIAGGCALVGQKAVEQGTGATVEKKGDTTTVTGKDGQQVTVGSQVPEALKKFSPPEGFNFQSGGSSSSAAGNISIGSWTGKGNIQTVLDFYRKSLTGQGWSEASFIQAGGQNVLMYKKDGDATNVSVTQTGDVIKIEVMTGPAAKDR